MSLNQKFYFNCISLFGFNQTYIKFILLALVSVCLHQPGIKFSNEVFGSIPGDYVYTRVLDRQKLDTHSFPARLGKARQSLSKLAVIWACFSKSVGVLNILFVLCIRIFDGYAR